MDNETCTICKSLKSIICKTISITWKFATILRPKAERTPRNKPTRLTLNHLSSGLVFLNKRRFLTNRYRRITFIPPENKKHYFNNYNNRDQLWHTHNSFEIKRRFDQIHGTSMITYCMRRHRVFVCHIYSFYWSVAAEIWPFRNWLHHVAYQYIQTQIFNSTFTCTRWDSVHRSITMFRDWSMSAAGPKCSFS